MAVTCLTTGDAEASRYIFITVREDACVVIVGVCDGKQVSAWASHWSHPSRHIVASFSVVIYKTPGAESRSMT